MYTIKLINWQRNELIHVKQYQQTQNKWKYERLNCVNDAK